MKQHICNNLKVLALIIEHNFNSRLVTKDLYIVNENEVNVVHLSPIDFYFNQITRKYLRVSSNFSMHVALDLPSFFHNAIVHKNELIKERRERKKIKFQDNYLSHLLIR